VTTFSDTELATVLERLQRLELAEAARELTARYALALDHRDFGALAELFTEDAVVEAGGETFTGRAAVMGFFRHAMEVIDPSDKKHLMMNHRVRQLTPGSAQVDSYFLYTAVGDESVLGWGTYADVVRVEADGLPRFATKSIVVDVAVDVRQGWARS
jgi:3-phenylpropionate/cinnamic acid dioxygenase small subunit